MINKCMSDQNTTSQECGGNNPNYKREAKLAQKNKKNGLMMN
jgi:hypothetical protein